MHSAFARAQVSSGRGSGRTWLAVGLALAIALDTVGQLLWKLAAGRLPEGLSPQLLLNAFLHDPLPIVVLAVFLLQLINWLHVLRRAELSYAQPITSLSYVTVVLSASWWLGERLDPTRLWGIGLVLLGVALIGIDALREGRRS